MIALLVLLATPPPAPVPVYSPPDGGNQMIVSSSVYAASWKRMPDCVADGGNALNYSQANQSFACGKLTGTVGGVTATLPLASSGGATPNLSGFVATMTDAGFLSAVDQTIGGLKHFTSGISTPLIDAGALLSVSATSMRFYGTDALWNQPVSFAASSTYFPGATASADFYNGIATGGPIVANTNGNGLRMAGRRVDGVANIYVENQHWFDGGVQFAVYAPGCGLGATPQFGVTNEHAFFGSGLTPTCSGNADLELGALVDSNLTAGHTSMMTGAPLEFIIRGDLSSNIGAWELPGPVAPVAANYSTNIVCTLPDAGTHFCYAGRHGHVVAGSRVESKQGWLFEVQNPGRASGAHVFYVSYWGSFGQEDQIPFTQFPDAGESGIVTTEGQYSYGVAGELAHDRVVLGDYTTGKWRVRETNPDGGPEWLYLVDSNDPIPTSQLSGTITDAQLASSYSGVGACTNQFARVLNDNAAPTCGSVVSADMNITTTSCSNQFVTAISSGGVGTCTTDTLASAQHANQGTTTTVLHGNAAGNPSWASVSLANDVTGVLGVTSGGTGAAPGADDQVLVSDSTSAATWRTMPNCTDTGGQHLNYTAASNSFSCGTSGGGSSPLTTKGDIYTFTTVDARKPVGADGLCLKSNSAEATGLEWASCSAGGGISYAEAAAAVMGGF